jgi:hypothetical protein
MENAGFPHWFACGGEPCALVKRYRMHLCVELHAQKAALPRFHHERIE